MAAPLLEVVGVSKSFPGVRALHDVNFHLDAGEVLVLVGENGAGKSTLMKILSGIYTRDQGIIRVDGEEVALATPAWRGLLRENAIAVQRMYAGLAERGVVAVWDRLQGAGQAQGAA